MNIEKAIQLYRDQGRSILRIAKELGHSTHTVSRHLKLAGIELGPQGRNRLVTDEYVSLTLKLRAEGMEWHAIEAKLGFDVRSLQRAIKKYALAESMAREAALQELLNVADQRIDELEGLLREVVGSRNYHVGFDRTARINAALDQRKAA